MEFLGIIEFTSESLEPCYIYVAKNKNDAYFIVDMFNTGMRRADNFTFESLEDLHEFYQDLYYNKKLESYL